MNKKQQKYTQTCPTCKAQKTVAYNAHRVAQRTGRIGVCRPCQYVALTGVPSKLRGFKHAPETCEKMRQAKLVRPTRYWLGKIRLDMAGPNSPTWKGGTSRIYKDGYNSIDYRRWRKQVFERDNYTCQDCGFHGSQGRITAHHIRSFAHFPDLRFEITNGKTLCEPCHKQTDNYKGRAKQLH